MLRKLNYGWIIFSLSFTNLLAEGGIKNTVPVVYVALRDHFRWSAAATSGVFSLAGLVGGLCAPLLGRLLDRMGPRYLFPLGGLLILLGYLSSSFVTDLWQLFILYSVIATLGENIISSFTTAATLSPWFPRTRGRMLGLADAGNPVGQVIFLPLAQLLIATIGWRDTFRIFGLMFFLLVAPANFLLQRRPPVQPGASESSGVNSPSPSMEEGWTRLEHNNRRDGGDSPASSAQFETGAPSHSPTRGEVVGVAGLQPVAVPQPSEVRQILRHPPVWFLVVARFLAGMGHHLTQVHIVAFFLSAGYNPLLAATAIGAVGLVGMVGRPISGTLSDCLGREIMYTIGSGMQICAVVVMLVLGNGHSLWPVIFFVGLSGLSDGIGGLVVGAKAADLFPTSSLGSVMGLVQMGRGLGIMLGPLIGGLLFDLQGDYLIAFTLATVLTAIAIGCMWGARLTSCSAHS